jgi:hypothetical protein
MVGVGSSVGRVVLRGCVRLRGRGIAVPSSFGGFTYVALARAMWKKKSSCEKDSTGSVGSLFSCKESSAVAAIVFATKKA